MLQTYSYIFSKWSILCIYPFSRFREVALNRGITHLEIWSAIVKFAIFVKIFTLILHAS